jgi:MFS family permease
MLAVLLLGQFMCIIDVLVTNVAMPSIAASLHASGASLQLVVGGYTIAYAMLLFNGCGVLPNRFGRTPHSLTPPGRPSPPRAPAVMPVRMGCRRPVAPRVWGCY